MLEQVQGPASDRWEAEVQLFIAILDMIVINNINLKANIIIFVKSTTLSFRDFKTGGLGLAVWVRLDQFREPGEAGTDTIQ